MAVGAQRASRGVVLRLAVVAGVVGALYVAVLGRAIELQIVQGPQLASLARDQYLRAAKLTPRRGPIVDRTGIPLAVSVDADSIYAEPGTMDRAAVDALARALGQDRASLEERLVAKHGFVWVKRKVPAAEADRVRALKLAGVGLVKESRRVYPQGDLAGHVVGYANIDGDGVAGVERGLDEALKGKQLEVLAYKDARGITVLENGAPAADDTSGATVQLTIDGAVQHAAERALKDAITGAQAVSGVAVAMDAKTGALLAVASEPPLDPNAPGLNPNAWRDRALADAVEPGSTVKTFVIAGALEDGVVKPGDVVDAENGAWKLGRRTIHDTHPHGALTVAEVMKYSSNIGAGKIGLKLGRERVVRWLRAFGFGERAGTGVPGEARGNVRDATNLPEIAVANMSFGQGMAATAVQLTAAMGAIASGGVLLRPYVVAKVVGPDGTVLREAHPEEERRVVSERTAAAMTAMLRSVVEKGGTGTRAAMADFTVAGKTGTAQKADPNGAGYSGKLLASFLGFAPAEEPRVVVLVMVDEPNVQAHFGGDVAAPAFATIAREALRAVGVLPAGSSELAGYTTVAHDEAPAPEAEVARDVGASRTVVPDLGGLTARAAARALSERALEAELRGTGHAVSQSPRPGAVVARGARVRVTLAPQG